MHYKAILLALASTALMSSAAYAQATGLPPPVPPPEAPPPTTVPPEQTVVPVMPPEPPPPPSSTEYYGVKLGPYIRGGYVHSWGASTGFGQGDGFDVGVGMRFSPMFRLEAAYTDRRWNNTFEVGGVKAPFTNWSAMLNAYADLNFEAVRPFIPYIGAGVGVSKNKVAGADVTVSGTTVGRLTGGSDNQFAWQAMAGISYYFSPYTALDVGYRFFDGGRATSGSSTTAFPGGSKDFRAHEVLASFRVGF